MQWLGRARRHLGATLIIALVAAVAVASGASASGLMTGHGRGAQSRVTVRCTSTGIAPAVGAKRASKAQLATARKNCAAARVAACHGRHGGRSHSLACGRKLRRRLARANRGRVTTARTSTAGSSPRAAAAATGDTLTLGQTGAGTQTIQFVASYYNGQDFISCGGTPTFWAGDIYGPCGNITFNDAVTGTTTSSNNSASDTEYDACGNVVGGSTTFGWYSTGDPNGNMVSGGWTGGMDDVVPYGEPPACAGTWTVSYSFSQTFTDQNTLTVSNSGPFTVRPDQVLNPNETMGGGNPSEMGCSQVCEGDPVNTASGDYWETTTDMSFGGRGMHLQMERTYSSVAAAAGASTLLGAGWTYNYNMALAVDAASGNVTITEANGSRTLFTPNGSGGFTAPGRTLATLVKNSDGTYAYKVRLKTTYAFSAAGQLTSITDLNGNKITLAYDTSNRLSTATDAAARKLTFAYDTAGKLASVTDSTGRKVTYTHVGSDLTAVTDVRASQWKYGYDTAHLLLTKTAPRGNVPVTNTYDASGRVLTQKDGLQQQTTYAYTGNPSTQTTVTDANGHATEYDYNNGLLQQKTQAVGTANARTWSYQYDSRGTLGVTQVTDPGYNVTAFTYDANGNKTSMTTPSNRKTTYAYDSLGDLTSQTGPDNVTTTYTYDSKGNLLTVSTPLSGSVTQKTTYTRDRTHGDDVTSVTDPNAKVTSFTYTTTGDVASVTDPNGNKTTYTYDALDRRLTKVSPRGNVSKGVPANFTTTWTYDPAGNVLSVKDPLTHTHATSYDANGNVATQTDAKNHVTAYAYDANDRQTKVTRADASTLLTGYDPVGNLTFQTDSANQTTTYTYDAFDQRQTMTDPLNRTTSYGHDVEGHLTSVTEPGGRVTSYGFDGDGRPTGISYSDGTTPGVSYGYDPAGRRTSMTDGTGTTSYTYDQLGRLTAVTDGHGASTSYGYDIANHQTTITYPNAKTVTRTFDAGGRITAITDWAAAKTTFAYDADSNLTTVTMPKNVDTYAYDNAGQLSSIKVAAGTTTVANLAYTRDNEGQLTAETPTGLPGAAQSYAYDALDRVTSAGGKAYAYDAAGNPTTVAGSAGFAYDAANQLTTGPSGAYAYDGFGQRTSGQGLTLGYDQAGRATSATSGATTTTYGYDGDSLRTSKTAGGATTSFAWDRSGALPLMSSDGSTSYVSAPAGHPLEQIASNGTTTWYHHDQLGSTRVLTGSAGTAVGTFSYDASGNLTGSTGTVTTPLGFLGEFRDAESGLIYLRARLYDPRSGQFVTRDPLTAGTRAPYGYAGGDPVNRLDPSGLCGFGSLGSVLDCVNPVSSGNVAYWGATKLSDATHGVVNLPWLLSRPAVVDAGAGLTCLFTDGVACPAAIGLAFGDSTAGVVAKGIATHWCNLGSLLAEEAMNAVLAWGGTLTLGVGSLAHGAPGYAQGLVRAGPLALQWLLDYALNHSGG